MSVIRVNIYNILLSHVYRCYGVLDAEVVGSGNVGEVEGAGHGCITGGQEPAGARGWDSSGKGRPVR